MIRLNDQQMTEEARSMRLDRILENPIFRRACHLAGVEPTVRQASKYVNAKGAAYAFASQAINELEQLAEGRSAGESNMMRRSTVHHDPLSPA